MSGEADSFRVNYKSHSTKGRLLTLTARCAVSEIETSDGERRLIHHSAFASSLYIRTISASRIGIYQGDPIVSVRFLIEERVRSTSYVVGYT